MLVRLVVMVLLVKLGECSFENNNYYGTAELMQAPRRSRLLSDFADRMPKSLATTAPLISSTAEPSPPSAKPTMDTLKRYARIFKMDVKTLTEQQKILLERIVERVARLGGTFEPTEAAEVDENGLSAEEGRARNKNKKNAAKINKIEMEPPSSTTPTPATRSAATKATSTKSANTKTVKRTTSGVISQKLKGGKSKVTQANDLASANATAVDLGNITTTSIVNILSTDNARENLYSRRPPTTHDKLVSPSAGPPNSKVSTTPSVPSSSELFSISQENKSRSFLLNGSLNGKNRNCKEPNGN